MQRIRYIVGILALAVFALRSLVPAGFMIDVSHGKQATLLGLEVVICTGHVATDHKDAAALPNAPQPKKQNSADICPYAGAGHTAHGTSLPASLETTIRYAEVVYALTAQVFAATPLPGPLSARGPPSRVI